ncbi:MAG: phosphomannomutase/phosphoglucomutase [Proteobacteria bacterium]|nr:phosphomannomutase/phosphoglucomutase [Pseudomonadota bacterium]
MGDAHNFNSTILREYDIRGIVGETLLEADAVAIGRGFGTLLRRRLHKSQPEVAVGFDGRTSSPVIEAALIRGLNASGVSVRRIGLGPTPMLYFAAHVLDVDGGLMVTGSHNPSEYNGVKMVFDGHSFFGEDIQELGRLGSAGDFETGEGSISEESVFDRYLDRLFQDYRAGAELTVAWDPGNGAAGEVVKTLTSRLPGRHILINADIDGGFPNHHPDPTVEKNLAQLKDVVAAESADLGVAFDGDGDRIGVVDSQGRVLWGDQLMVLYGRDVLSRLPGASIIADVKASQALFDEIARAGGDPVMWKTGHSLIKTKMAELNAPLAGEMSGHIFFADQYYGYDDAVYAAIRLLSILGESSETLADMRDGLPQLINTPELRFDCPEERKFAVIEEVRERLASIDGINVHDTDGVRVVSDDGWWLLRASNTQSVLVARCESSDEEGLARLKEMLAGQLEKSGMEMPAID